MLPDEGARAMISAVSNGFVEFEVDGVDRYGPDGPLDWPGYALSRKRAQARSDESESVVCGRGRIGGTDAVLVAFDFRFLGGSVGTATGARMVRAFTRARELGLPVVSLIATGGSRMQEGILSLHQLQRVAHQCALLRARAIPHVSVLRDPTTGGVWASLGAGADVVLAVAGAQIGFAGRRVRQVAHADDPAYTAEGQFAAGHVDEVVAKRELAATLAEWLELLRGHGPDREPAEVPRALGEPAAAEDGWRAVLRARSTARPRAEAYLDDYFESRRSIRGDRAGGVDPGLLCGIGRRGGRSIAFAAQAGTATTPAGFRTASRLIRLADRLGLPVLTLVDTPGAAADPAAERTGVGPAIAELSGTAASATVPITTLVIGEGGSGGALALCSPDRMWVTPDAYFSVIAPELAAAILKRDPAEVPATADHLRLRPQDLVDLGVAQGIASS